MYSVHVHAKLEQMQVGLTMHTLLQMSLLYYFTDEEEVVPPKLKKAVRQSETKTNKEIVHVKER